LVARRPNGAARPERLLRELNRIIAEVAHGVDEVIGHPRPTPASLHRLHRDMRRLRTGLHVWEELLDTADRAHLRPVLARLRRLAQLIGQVRDRDVSLGLLEGVTDQAGSDLELERLRQYHSRLQDDARTGRELLRAFLRSERQSHLFDHIGESLKSPRHPIHAGRLRRVLATHQQQRLENVVRAHRKARRRPSMDRLHRLRIHVRRLRQVSDIASTIDPTSDPTLAESLRRLQQHLGRLHDLDLVVHNLEPSLRRTAWARALRKERRRQRKAIVKVLKSRRPDRPSSP
jgi:CHAD domain-containing protein